MDPVAHLSAQQLLDYAQATPAIADSAGAHLQECDVCGQRLEMARLLALSPEALGEEISRAENRARDVDAGGPRPGEDLVAGFSHRLEQILRFRPLLRLAAADDKRQLGSLGRLEVAVLLLKGILNRMETGEGGATREQLHREVGAAIAWYEHGRAYIPTTAAQRRELIDELLDELTNARAQGRPFQDTYHGYHLPIPGRAQLDFRLVVYREHEGELRYSVTEQGLDLFYRLHEVDHFLSVEMELLLLLRQIERGQFERALSSLERLATACGLQRRRMDQLSARIRRDPLSVPPGEIERNDTEVRKQLDEEKKLFRQVRKAIDLQWDKLSDLFNASGDRRKRMDQLSRLRRGLDRSFEIHQGLVSENLSLRRRYLSALEKSASLRNRYRALKLEPDVLEPFAALPAHEGRDTALAGLLLPLRRPRLFAPWHLPFSLRAEHEFDAPPDFFMLGWETLEGAGSGYDLAQQARVHGALLHELVLAGGSARLSRLVGGAVLAPLVVEDAFLVGVHALFLHNAHQVRLGDPADPFSTIHRLAAANIPAAAQNALLVTRAAPGRCELGDCDIRELHFELRDGGPRDAAAA
ncbi:MAG: hypothetical protein QM765_39110 [Myxococcales bacterium]